MSIRRIIADRRYHAPILTQSSDLRDGLVSFWRLEESSVTRFDSVGPNDLSTSGNTLNIVGMHGNCNIFVAATLDYLKITRAAFMGLSPGGGFTVAGWFQVAAPTNRIRLGVGSWDAAGFCEWRMQMTTTAQVFQVSENGTTASGATASLAESILAGEWYFLAGRYNDVTRRTYIWLDSGAVTAVSGSTAASMYDSVTQDFYIGTHGALTVFSDGRVDSLGFWDRCLGDSELSYLYNRGAGKDIGDL